MSAATAPASRGFAPSRALRCRGRGEETAAVARSRRVAARDLVASSRRFERPRATASDDASTSSSSSSSSSSSTSTAPPAPKPTPEDIASVAAFFLETTAAATASVPLVGDVARAFARAFEPTPADFPPGPPGDAAVELAADPIAFIVKTQREHGDVVGLRLAGEHVVLVSDPDVVRDVAIDRADLFVKEGTAFFPGSSLAGEGLLVSDGEKWARQRRLSNPAFRAAAVDAYATAMTRAGERLLRGPWSARTIRDAYADFNDLTLEIVADALFGADVRGARAKEINAAIAEAFEFFGKRSSSGFIVPEWAPTPENAGYAAAVARLDDAVYALIAERRAKREKPRYERLELLDEDREDEFVEEEEEEEEEEVPGGSSSTTPSRGPDLLDRLLDARDDGDGGDGGGMTDASLRDELMTLMVAGQETSAILLSWCCALLAQHPEVAERCAAEARAVLGDGSGGGDGDDEIEIASPTAENVGEMKYVEAVVLETMRLYPPAYMVGRCAARDVVVGGHSLRKGTTILIAPYLLHRDARRWDDPDAFDPERWLRPGGAPKKSESESESESESATDDRPMTDAPPMAKGALRGTGPGGVYLPFGAGPRVCIGTGFAMMEATILVAMIASTVDLKTLPGRAPPRPRALITLRPDNVELDVIPKRRGARARTGVGGVARSE